MMPTMPTDHPRQANHVNPKQLAPGLAIAIALAILALIWLAMIHASPTPAPAGNSTAPAAAFSAERAMLHLRRIADKPHPIGSVEHDKVRDMLVEQLKALGLEPEIQTSILGLGSSKVAGRVQNILVRLPGTSGNSGNAGKALLLAAHYDSVPTGPGAADDGASVAAILETLRALKTGPALKNDVMVLLSDGEEVGLLGAYAFVKHHPWAKQVGMVLNFEYRGNSGAIWMFETSSGNGKMIQGFSQAVAHPMGNSLLYEVYKKMPNYTDLTIFKQAALPGLNFAAGERHNSYHTMLDSADLLDQATLRHQGETMLALTRHFGQQALDDIPAADRVYFDAPGLGLVHYPVAWVLPLSGLTLVLFGALLFTCLKNNTARAAYVLLALVGFILTIALVAVASLGLWLFILRLHPGYNSLLHGATYNDGWYLLFFVALAVSLFMLLQTWLRRWIRPLESTLAGFLLWVLLLVAVSVALPGVSFLFTWPLLPMLLAWLFLERRTVSGTLRAVIMLGAASPAILIFTPIVHLLYNALTPAMVLVPIIVLGLLLALLHGLQDLLSQYRPLRFAPQVLAIVFFGMGEATSGFSALHPQQNSLFLVEVPARQQAFWVSADAHLDSWNQRFFPPDAKHDNASDLFGLGSHQYWRSPAPLQNLAAPQIQLLEDRVADGRRTLKLAIRSTRQAPRINIRVKGIAVSAARVEQADFTQPGPNAWEMNGYAMGDQALQIELTVAAGQAFSVLVRDISYGLPANLVDARPANMMVQPFRTSDTQQVLAELKIDAGVAK